jgi:hypothetical protein
MRKKAPKAATHKLRNPEHPQAAKATSPRNASTRNSLNHSPATTTTTTIGILQEQPAMHRHLFLSAGLPPRPRPPTIESRPGRVWTAAQTHHSQTRCDARTGSMADPRRRRFLRWRRSTRLRRGSSCRWRRRRHRKRRKSIRGHRHKLRYTGCVAVDRLGMAR